MRGIRVPNNGFCAGEVRSFTMLKRDGVRSGRMRSEVPMRDQKNRLHLIKIAIEENDVTYGDATYRHLWL